MIELTSLKNSIVQHAMRLQKERAFRYAEGQVVIVGDHLVKELSESTPLLMLFTLDPYQKLPAKDTFFVTKEIFEKIAGIACHDQLAAIVALPPFRPITGERLLVFDRLQDPGNVGTLLRSMEAFGFDQAVFLEDTVDPFNEKVIRSSMGASFRVPLAKGTLETLLAADIPLIGAAMEGISIENYTTPQKFALVLGHEGKGLAKELKKRAKLVKIPMCPPVESLNVAQAGAILLYHLGKTRGL